MSPPLVSILIPHYNTPELTSLCLQLLKKNTDLSQVSIYVIDNKSTDGYYAELEKMSWINPIRRISSVPEKPPISHARALDLALTDVNTPYVLSIHTDTLCTRLGWLDYLLQHIEEDPLNAGVGSWKLEMKPWYKRIAKGIESNLQSLSHRIMLTNETLEQSRSVGKSNQYLRSHCALYRTDLLKNYGLSFGGSGEAAGKDIHHQLVSKGHRMVFLDPEELMQFMLHLNHATGKLKIRRHWSYSRTRINRRMQRLAKQQAAKDSSAISAD